MDGGLAVLVCGALRRGSFLDHEYELEHEEALPHLVVRGATIASETLSSISLSYSFGLSHGAKSLVEHQCMGFRWLW